MNLSYLSKKILIQCLLLLIIVLIFVFSLSIPAVTDSLNRYNSLSYYADSLFDYKVHGASRDQIEEFKGLDCVDRVVSFYESSAAINDSSDYCIAQLYNELDEINISSFSDARLIDQQSDMENSIYIDLTIAKKFNLGLNDEITVSVDGIQNNLKVTRIYRPCDKFTDGLIVFKKDLSKYHNDNMCYIRAKDIKNLDDKLREYQPLGIKKDRSEFVDDESYNEYLEFFDSINYYNQIENKNKDYLSKQDEMVSEESSTQRMIISVSMVAILAILVCVILNILFSKSYAKDFELGRRNIKKVIAKLLSIDCISVFVTFIIGLITVQFSKYKLVFILQELLTDKSLVYLYAGLVATICIMLIDLIFTGILLHKNKVNNQVEKNRG